jgi:hypothetical protein
VATRARRTDAGRQRPAEPGDVRHHLDGAAGRAADGRVRRQEHDRQGRVPADCGVRAVVREHPGRPVARPGPGGGHRLLDHRLQRGGHAGRDRAQAPMGRAAAGRPGAPAEPGDGHQRAGLLGEVQHRVRPARRRPHRDHPAAPRPAGPGRDQRPIRRPARRVRPADLAQPAPVRARLRPVPGLQLRRVPVVPARGPAARHAAAAAPGPVLGGRAVRAVRHPAPAHRPDQLADDPRVAVLLRRSHGAWAQQLDGVTGCAAPGPC